MRYAVLRVSVGTIKGALIAAVMGASEEAWAEAHANEHRRERNEPQVMTPTLKLFSPGEAAVGAVVGAWFALVELAVERTR